MEGSPCDAGYGGSESTSCVECEAGVMYKPSAGDSPCLYCDPHSSGCGPVSAGVCKAGYYGHAGSVSCKACPVATYKHEEVDGAEVTVCSACPTGTTTLTSGTTDLLA